jgi:hypothetical protein
MNLLGKKETNNAIYYFLCEKLLDYPEEKKNSFAIISLNISF